MTTYRVEQDGNTVYEHETDEYDKDGIPAEYRQRPATGEIRLYVDDELISVSVPIAEAEAQAIAAQRAADLEAE